MSIRICNFKYAIKNKLIATETALLSKKEFLAGYWEKPAHKDLR